jgi:hypothetical protein
VDREASGRKGDIVKPVCNSNPYRLQTETQTAVTLTGTEANASLSLKRVTLLKEQYHGYSSRN